MMTKMVFKVLSKEWSQRHKVDQDLRQRVNQDDQHTKRTRCTERDQVIPWYGFVHRHFLKSICWVQGVYMMTKMVFKVLSKEWSQRHKVDQDLRQRVNQDDQHTKRTRCTERDQVIPWYGKHCPLRVCVLTHGLRESSMWGLGVFPWACVKRKISYNP